MLLLAAAGGAIWASDGPFTSAGRARILVGIVLVAVAVLAAIRPVPLRVMTLT
jgi:hypothetical protein